VCGEGGGGTASCWVLRPTVEVSTGTLVLMVRFFFITSFTSSCIHPTYQNPMNVWLLAWDQMSERPA